MRDIASFLESVFLDFAFGFVFDGFDCTLFLLTCVDNGGSDDEEEKEEGEEEEDEGGEEEEEEEEEVEEEDCMESGGLDNSSNKD